MRKSTVQRLAEGLQQLRETLPLLPQDPYLLLNHNGWQSKNVQDASAAGHRAGGRRNHPGGRRAGPGRASMRPGPISRGFASSSGAFGWHQANSFNFDFSLFHDNGQAVKASYAGHDWNSEGFAKRFQQAREQLGVSGPTATHPGAGSVPRLPGAGGAGRNHGHAGLGRFLGAVDCQQEQSAAEALRGRPARSARWCRVDEKVSGSLSPAFSGEGYPRSDLELIVEGKAGAQMVSSRSAAEYGLTANGASGGEMPSALNMAAGELPEAQILKQLGTGLYISNLWYLNYSDQPAARLTGMTRFATFWVENGEIQAPVSTMRFDDSAYSLLGSQLEALTEERELLLSASTYSQRATASALLPGALISRLTLTL